jgi:hypothetical protein
MFDAAGTAQHTVAPSGTASTNAAAANPASAAAAASANADPFVPPNTTAAILGGSASTGLATFNASSAVQAFLKTSVQGYIDARATYNKAKAALSRFETTCSRGLGQSGIQLPKSMQLQLVKSVRFDTVADDPNFNRSAIEQLQRVEQETSKQIYDIMLAAKKRLVTHLHAKQNAHVIANLQTIAFENAILNDYARSYDDNFASASADSSFPRIAASQAFTSELLARLTACFTEEQEARRQTEKQKEAREAEERKAQEQIVAGIHTGANIRSIAEKAALKVVDDAKQKQVRFQQTQQSRAAAPASAKPSPVPIAMNRQKSTANTSRPSWAPPLAQVEPSSTPRPAMATASHKRGREALSPSRSPSRDRRVRSQSPTNRRDHMSRRDYAGHKGNDRREPPQSIGTAHRSAGHRPIERPHDRNSLPKNGQGGDRHQANQVRPSSQHSEAQRSSFLHRENERERNSHGHTQPRSNRH